MAINIKTLASWKQITVILQCEECSILTMKIDNQQQLSQIINNAFLLEGDYDCDGHSDGGDGDGDGDGDCDGDGDGDG